MIMAASLGLAFSAPFPASADDLDDKISTYTDDSVAADHNLGGEGINIKYKKLDAKSRAKVRENASKKKGDGSSDKSGKKNKQGSGNMNSVVMGAGSNIKGDIIIIDESKGNKTQIVDK